MRSVLPSNSLRKAGYSTNILNIQHWLQNTPEARVACSNSDIISIQRVLVEESIKQADFWIARKKAVSVDWDDHYRGVIHSTGNPAKIFWHDSMVTVNTPYGSYQSKLDRHPMTQFEEGLTKITAGTVPSRIIVDDYKHLARMFYLPNYILAERYHEAHRSKNDNIIIGYGPSMGHLQSVQDSGVNNALARVVRDRPNVRVLIVGDQRLLPLLPISKQSLLFHQYVPYFEWPDMLGRFDVSLAPLYHEFDKRRSFLKAAEAAMMGIPLVATYDELYPVYDEFKDFSSMRFVPSELTVPNYDERVELWYNALLDVVDNLSDYRERAKRNVDRAMAFDVDANVQNIVSVYEEILNLR